MVASTNFNLSNINAALVLDNSGSMDTRLDNKFTRWTAGIESLKAVGKKLCSLDSDGITTGVFGTGYDIKDNVTADQLDALFSRWSANGGGTNLAGPLQHLVNLFFPAQYETRVEQQKYTAYENVLESQEYEVLEDVKVKNPRAGQKKGGFSGLFGGTEPEFITEKQKVKKTRQVTVQKPVEKTREVSVRGYKKVSPEKQVCLVFYTDGEAGDPDAAARVIIDATKRINGRRDLGILFIVVGNDPKAWDFLQRLNDRLKPEGADHDIVAVVKLEDVEDYSPEQLLELAFTA